MSENQPERPSRRVQAERRARTLLPYVYLVLGCALVAGLVVLLLSRAGSPNLSPAEVSGTAEAARFATSQAERRGTREAARATGTAVARGTATAAAGETSAAVTSVAKATAEAPPTLTAEASARETAQARAEATSQVIDERTALVYGPESGTLEQVEGDEVPCAAAGVDLREFIAEARFANPAGSGLEAEQAWDYGLVFTNIGEGTEYRVILDSEGSWTFNLHSEAYDISFSDTTDLLDLSARGSNTLKLYVTGDAAQMYINGRYLDTFDLVILGLGRSEEATHDVMACAGMREEYRDVGRRALYEEFRVWAVP